MISGWMVNELKLKGNDLLVYAIIYGFSQEEGQAFSGSLQYLADWTSSSKQGIQKNLKSLIDKGYIRKEVVTIDGKRIVRYCATELNKVCNSVAQGIQLSCMGYTTELHRSMQHSCTNNIINNIDENIDDKNVEFEFEKLWEIYPRKEGRKAALAAYKKARTRKDSPCSFEQVRNGIEKYLIKTANCDMRYIKCGSSYFNGECWNDEYSSQTSPEKPVDPEIEKYKVLINKF